MFGSSGAAIDASRFARTRPRRADSPPNTQVRLRHSCDRPLTVTSSASNEHARSIDGGGATLRTSIVRERWRASRLPSSVGASRP
jgi:hypothetical protein